MDQMIASLGSGRGQGLGADRRELRSLRVSKKELSELFLPHQGEGGPGALAVAAAGAQGAAVALCCWGPWPEASPALKLEGAQSGGLTEYGPLLGGGGVAGRKGRGSDRAVADHRETKARKAVRKISSEPEQPAAPTVCAHAGALPISTGAPAPSPAPTPQGGAGTRPPLGLGLPESSLGKPERGGHGRGHRERAAVEGEAGGGHFRGGGPGAPCRRPALGTTSSRPSLRAGMASLSSAQPCSAGRGAEPCLGPTPGDSGGPRAPPSAAPPALHPCPPRPRAPVLPAPEQDSRDCPGGTRGEAGKRLVPYAPGPGFRPHSMGTQTVED